MEKKVDYIIVGDGFAAMFLAHQLIKAGNSFLLFSEGKKGASQVSAGIVNPVVLKKFTTFNNAKKQIEQFRITCQELEEYLHINVIEENRIVRIFHNEKEKDVWIKKSQEENLNQFLNPETFSIENIKNNHGVGEVFYSCRLNVNRFFHEMFSYLDNSGNLVKERFDYSKIDTENQTYSGTAYRAIIFCEGISVFDNPYFSDINIQPNKGHHLSVKLSTPIEKNYIYKKKHFLFPTENNLFYYGGTYDRENTGTEVDDRAVKQLVNGLEEIYTSSYEIESINVGIRPTTPDRRPIIGKNREFSNLFVFNGLGTRGILNGNYYAKKLYEHLEKNEPLLEEVTIDRF